MEKGSRLTAPTAICINKLAFEDFPEVLPT